MHPFGGTPVCPRCSRVVYAAEQVMGPGRKLYHKPCLACTTCNKRLDSLTLLEHDQEPYCKTCHIRNFGTRDLRHANLPHRNDDPSSPPPLPASPVRNSCPTPTPMYSDPIDSNEPQVAQLPVHAHNPAYTSGAALPPPILKANSVLPVLRKRSPSSENPTNPSQQYEEVLENPMTPPRSSEGTATSQTRNGNTPYTIPSSPSKPAANGTPATSTPRFFSVTHGRSNSSPMASLQSTPTGTRYGAALGGGGSPSKVFSMGATPVCPRCEKSVYFAEQMKAIGKTWHKGCLRCKECNTLLDSKRLTEKDGDPLCHQCYSKLHGPAGSGYALHGKAGG